MQPATAFFDHSLEYRSAGRQRIDRTACLFDRNVVVRPGVGGEGGEAFDGFDVGGVVVAHDGAGAGEEAVGAGSQLLPKGLLGQVG